MATTRAAVLASIDAPLEVLSLDLESPREGEVLIQTLAAGVCHSDYHVMMGDTNHPLPAVLGHEGAGRVVEIGPGVSMVGVGDLVILNWAPSCGECFYCTHGMPNLCSTFLEPIWAGAQLDGTTRLNLNGTAVTQFCGLGCFSDLAVVSEKACVRAPDDLPAEVAALIGCAVTTGIGSVFNTAKVEPGSVVAILGAGGVGLSTVLGAALAKASTIVVVDPMESRRRAASELGSSHTADSFASALDLVHGLTGGRGADYVFEASGAVTAQEQSLSLTRPGGTIIFTGLSRMGSATNLPGSRLVREEKTIKGSYYGSSDPHRDFHKIVKLFLDGKLPLEKLISHRYELDEINLAFADMLSGASRRGIVLF